MDILIISLGSEAGESASGEPVVEGAASTPTPTPAAARAPNKFALQNVSKFQRLISPCLHADTSGIRQRLLRLIQRVAALYGPGHAPREFQEAAFWDNLRGTLDRRLTVALADKSAQATAPHQPSSPSNPAAVTASATAAAAGGGAGGSGAGGVGGADGDGYRTKALLSVRVLEMVAQVFPPFPDSHATSLMELVRLLSLQHFHQVTAVAASIAARFAGGTAAAAAAAAAAVSLPPGLGGGDPLSPSSRLLPTPSMAVLNTAVTVDGVADDPPLSENLEVRTERSGRDVVARSIFRRWCL